jgi:hypothetical protein
LDKSCNAFQGISTINKERNEKLVEYIKVVDVIVVQCWDSDVNIVEKFLKVLELGVIWEQVKSTGVSVALC